MKKIIIGIVVSFSVMLLLPLIITGTIINSITSVFSYFDQATESDIEFSLTKSQNDYILNNNFELNNLLTASCLFLESNLTTPNICMNEAYLEANKHELIESDIYIMLSEMLINQGYTLFSGSIPDYQFINGISYPLNNNKAISQYYEFRISPVLGNEFEFHNALDMPANEGTPLYAFFDGKIIVQNEDDIKGKNIILETYNILNYPECTYQKVSDEISNQPPKYEYICPDNYVEPEDRNDIRLKVSYLHMSDFNSALDDYVSSGDTIGFVGATGAVTGAHVHFTIQISIDSGNTYKYINPLMLTKHAS